MHVKQKWYNSFYRLITNLQDSREKHLDYVGEVKFYSKALWYSRSYYLPIFA